MNYRILLFFLVVLLAGCGGVEGTETNDQQEGASDENIDTTATAKAPGKIIFFGNSLTAAYGLDPEQGFPALIRQKIDSLGFDYQVVNAGLSGETSAGGNERVEWVLQQGVDIFVLELGANDGLRGIDPQTTYQNLQSIIDQVKAAAPEADIVLAGMEAPPNMGAEFTAAFRDIYPRLARENNLPLIPFLLENVGGIRELNQADGIHPTADGQKIVAENVWEVLLPLLEKPVQ